MSLREDFERDLALHIAQQLKQAAERRGGLNILLNELFYSQADSTPTGDIEQNLHYRRGRIEKILSSEAIEVTIQKVELNSQFLPSWTLGLMFNFADEAWQWRIDFITLTIEPDDSYQIGYWSFFNENPSPEDAEADDPLWQAYTNLINGDTMVNNPNERP